MKNVCPLYNETGSLVSRWLVGFLQHTAISWSHHCSFLMQYLAHHNVSSQIETSVGGNVEPLTFYPLCSWVQWAWIGMDEETLKPTVWIIGQSVWQCTEEGAIDDHLYGKQIIFHFGPISRNPFTYLLLKAHCHQLYNLHFMSLLIGQKKFFTTHALP